MLKHILTREKWCIAANTDVELARVQAQTPLLLVVVVGLIILLLTTAKLLIGARAEQIVSQFCTIPNHDWRLRHDQIVELRVVELA